MKADQGVTVKMLRDAAVQNVLVVEPRALSDGVYDRGVGKRQAKRLPSF